MNEEIKKILVEEFKQQGLEIAEEAAVRAVKATFKALPRIAAVTENKIDDVVAPLVAVAEPKIIELLDGIDGVKGNASN